MLVPNVIIPWNGTHSSIPTNWSRTTVFDGRNVKSGSAYAQGGSDTHSHTSSPHAHTINSHNHSLTFGDDSHTSSVLHGDEPEVSMLPVHNHASVQSGAMTATVTDENSSPTWASASNIPSSREVIFIKSNAYNMLPDKAVVLREDKNRSLPYFTDAEGKYLRGVGTGADAGSNVGSNNHGHDIGHGHIGKSHNHASVQTGTPIYSGGLIGGFSHSPESFSSEGHRHLVTMVESTHNPSNYVNSNAGISDIINLKYQEFYAYLNNVNGGLPMKGDLAFWVESSSPPVGWELAGYADDLYIKVASESSGSLSSGGNLTHAHASVSHTHSASGHIHGASTGGQLSGSVWGNTTGDYHNTSVWTHTHSVTVSSVAVNRTNGTINCSTVSHEPKWVAVKIIRMKFLATGGMMLV